jgi:phenylacetate-CoA ligase
MQVKRLKYVVDHAYRHTVLYHNKFKKAGIHPSDIQTLPDLKKIPITTKDELRKPESVTARGYTCDTHTTTGSTGQKLVIHYNKKATDFYSALHFRRHVSLGIRPWHTFVPVSSVKRDKSQLRFPQFSRVHPVSSDLDEKTIVKTLKKVRPHILGGHPFNLFLIAKEVERQQLTIILRAVLIGGELSTPEERDYIQTVFNCEIFNKYGSMELRHIAWECPEHGMHIDADNNIIEVLNDNEEVNPGESGEVIGTNLWNMAMPFIRYNQADIASPSDEVCTCGRGLPLLSVVQGRRDDFIVINNQLIPPTRIVPIFFLLPEIDAFQVIQEDETTIRIKIVKGASFTGNTVKTLLKKIQYVTGEAVELIIEECDTIKEDNQKLRAVISRVKKH